MPLGDLVGLEEVPVLGPVHVVQGEQRPAAGVLKNIGVGELLCPGLHGLDAPGVVRVRGLFEVVIPGAVPPTTDDAAKHKTKVL